MRPERYGEVRPPAEVMAYARDLTSVSVDELGDDLVGVYLHGSAVLGGFHPTASDVDVLDVTGTPVDRAVQARLGSLLACAGTCPGAGLELSVITAGTAANLGSCPVAGRGCSGVGLGDGQRQCALPGAQCLPG